MWSITSAKAAPCWSRRGRNSGRWTASTARPLAEILPVAPTSQVIEQGFRPKITDIGRRHPVTEGLEREAPEGGWGRWFRQIEVEQTAGQVLMSGIDDLPLLVLNRVDQGRVAVLASDQMWLWGRGYEGGGPQLELLRRLAHWMLKEPELEEETLTAEVKGEAMTITRRTLAEEDPGPVTITAPDGTTTDLALPMTAPGHYVAGFQGADAGPLPAGAGRVDPGHRRWSRHAARIRRDHRLGRGPVAAGAGDEGRGHAAGSQAIPASAGSPRAGSPPVAAGSASPRARPI